jgi:DNA/RNA endonuclease YhcR with UshA esterase domain
MRTLIRLLFAAALLVSGTAALPQQAKPDVPKYDPKKEVTIKGVITEIKDYSCPISGAVGAHITLKTGDGLIEVHVAASKFLQQYGIRFNVGDSIQATGNLIEFNGKPAFLPRVIVVGTDSYFLRDPKGNPLW